MKTGSIQLLHPVTSSILAYDTHQARHSLASPEKVAAVNPDLVVRDAKGELSTVRYEVVNAMLLNEFLKEHKAFLKEPRKNYKRVRRGSKSELKRLLRAYKK
jgi:hypothetical protein